MPKPKHCAVKLEVELTFDLTDSSNNITERDARMLASQLTCLIAKTESSSPLGLLGNGTLKNINSRPILKLN